MQVDLITILLSTLAVSVSALPVAASNVNPGPSSAAADCASFMTTVVRSCAQTVLSTITVSTTLAGAGAAATVESTTTTTTTITKLPVVTGSPATGSKTTVTTTSILLKTSTTTIVTTSTSTATVSTGVLPVKRGDGPIPLMIKLPRLDTLGKRAEAATCPTTSSSNVVPTYASLCSGTSRYSSACSCNGQTAAIRTEAGTTTTSTVTSTSTISADDQATITKVNTVTVSTTTTVSTSASSVNPSVTTSTRTVTSTSTTLIVKTSTVKARATQTVFPSTGNFYLAATNQYYVNSDPSTPGDSLVEGLTSAVILYLDSNGNLRGVNGELFYANVALTGHDIVNLQNPAGYFEGVPAANRLTCVLQDPIDRAGLLSCVAGAGTSTPQNVFQFCGTTLYLSSTVHPECTGVLLQANPYLG